MVRNDKSLLHRSRDIFQVNMFMQKLRILFNRDTNSVIRILSIKLNQNVKTLDLYVNLKQKPCIYNLFVITTSCQPLIRTLR